LLASYQDPRGKLVIATTRIDARGQPATDPPRVYAPGKFQPDEADQDLMALLAQCRGTHCARYESTADLTFQAAPDGGLYLARIAVTVHDGACSSAYGGP